MDILLAVNTVDDYRSLAENFQCYEVPTYKECEAILTEVYRVPGNLRRHSIKVAEVAQVIGDTLLEAGQEPDLTVIRAVAMLHDIDRNALVSIKSKWESTFSPGKRITER